MSDSHDNTAPTSAKTPLSTPPGKIEPNGTQASLLFRRTLAHPPEKVWRALTRPEELEKWFMTSAKVGGGLGGRVEMLGGPAQFLWTGEILTWDPPHVFEYQWNIEPRKELPLGEKTVVRWELRAVEGGTELTMHHINLSMPTAIGFAPGTHAYLDRLEAHLSDAVLPNWTVRYGEVASAYPSWQR